MHTLTSLAREQGREIAIGAMEDGHPEPEESCWHFWGQLDEEDGGPPEPGTVDAETHRAIRRAFRDGWTSAQGACPLSPDECVLTRAEYSAAARSTITIPACPTHGA